MNHSIQALCVAIKKIILENKPQNKGFSFVIVTGKHHQGKKTLLRQSQFQHLMADDEFNTPIFYNKHGILIEMGEAWLEQGSSLLQHTFKKLNRCHPQVQITGMILCVAIEELSMIEPIELSKYIKSHTHLLNQFGAALGYRVDASIMMTKMDSLAGFCDFYEHDHTAELNKPLGFTLVETSGQAKINMIFKKQFDQFTESVGQQVLNKVHSARSGLKRTLIREFPLQIASLRLALQSLVEDIHVHFFRVQSVFFTSAEQGGFSLDQLNKKIQHEYALTVQDKFPISHNFRAYFIKGALLAFQAQTKRFAVEAPSIDFKKIGLIAGISAIAMSVLIYQHIHSSHILDKASKEWLAYDAMSIQNPGETSALSHLMNASFMLEELNHHLMPLNAVQNLKWQLENNKTKHMNGIFMPTILKELEEVLTNQQQPNGLRYEALKVYLMLGDPQHHQPDIVNAWFNAHWANEIHSPVVQHKLALLHQALTLPRQPIPINQQLVNDTRNFLKALPPNYLYYSIAKNTFVGDKSHPNLPLDIQGFHLANTEIPYYVTKNGFQSVVQQLPKIVESLSNEAWVLDQPAPANLNELLIQAYSYDYTLWWKNFSQKTMPLNVQNYSDAIHLIQTLRQNNAIQHLIGVIQEHTSPELSESGFLFNQHVASQFTDINLITESSIHPVIQALNDLEKFLTTISIVNDGGKTAFTIAKSRFQEDHLNNPLSILFSQSEQLPEPVANWTKQLANDDWFLIMNDTKQYINTQWKTMVYDDYMKSIDARYPFDTTQKEEVALHDFNRFFSTHGVFNRFIEQYIKPFLDTSEAQWKPKELNNFMLPISSETLQEIIRANIISNMFFAENADASQIHFSLQKSDLDPLISSLYLAIGTKAFNDTQDNSSYTEFEWPASDVKLTIKLAEGQEFNLEEKGPWAWFRILQKAEVQTDNDSAQLQVLLGVGGNSGRYLLKAKNEMNPFTPGVLNGFKLNDRVA